MTTGGYLRSNYSRTGKSNSMTSIGGAYFQTSYVGSAAGLTGGQGLTSPYGGFIMGSIVTSGDSFIGASNLVQISGMGAMSAWFGSGLFDSGYAIVPIAIQAKLNMASTSGFNNIWASVTATGSIVTFLTGGSATSAANSCWSAAFIWAGFIVSAP